MKYYIVINNSSQTGCFSSIQFGEVRRGERNGSMEKTKYPASSNHIAYCKVRFPVLNYIWFVGIKLNVNLCVTIAPRVLSQGNLTAFFTNIEDKQH